MTKFLQDNNPPRVWDKVKSKVTVVFKNGEFETEDPAMIDLLVMAGYRTIGVSTDIKSDQEDKKTMRTAKTKLVGMKNEPSKTN